MPRFRIASHVHRRCNARRLQQNRMVMRKWTSERYVKRFALHWLLHDQARYLSVDRHRSAPIDRNSGYLTKN